MDLRTLSLFVEVARRCSFAAVARDRDAEPSSVSRIIGLLEDELGFRLFHRSTRRMSLTEAGSVYLQRITPLIEQFDLARDDGLAVTTGPSGTLRLTASVAFGMTQLVPLLPAFRAAYPKVDVELLLDDANLDLIDERIDLAVRLAPSVQADVIGSRLMETHYRVCATPTYINSHGMPRAPAELAAHRCLLFTLPEYRKRWLFRDASGEVQAVPVAGDIVISNALTLRSAAKLGLGPSLLPNWLIDMDVNSGELIDLFPSFRATATDFSTAAWLLYPSRAFVPGKVRSAIDFFRSHLPTRPWRPGGPESETQAQTLRHPD